MCLREILGVFGVWDCELYHCLIWIFYFIIHVNILSLTPTLCISLFAQHIPLLFLFHFMYITLCVINHDMHMFNYFIRMGVNTKFPNRRKSNNWKEIWFANINLYWCIMSTISISILLQKNTLWFYLHWIWLEQESSWL